MSLLHLRNQGFFRAAFLAGADHDRGAMSVVGAQVDAPPALQLLKPHPDVRLDVLDQVAMWIGPFAYGKAEVTRILRWLMKAPSTVRVGDRPGARATL